MKKKKNNFNQVILVGFVKNCNDDEKVRDHCHVTGKFRGAAYLKVKQAVLIMK